MKRILCCLLFILPLKTSVLSSELVLVAPYSSGVQFQQPVETPKLNLVNQMITNLISGTTKHLRLASSYYAREESNTNAIKSFNPSELTGLPLASCQGIQKYNRDTVDNTSCFEVDEKKIALKFCRKMGSYRSVKSYSTKDSDTTVCTMYVKIDSHGEENYGSGFTTMREWFYCHKTFTEITCSIYER